MEYEFTDEMGEISGFGGRYEDTCRVMVVAGLKWLDENPEADPKFTAYKNIYGVISEDNKDVKTLTKVMVEASGNDCTGAMHQATVGTVLWIKHRSWAEYIEMMSS